MEKKEVLPCGEGLGGIGGSAIGDGVKVMSDSSSRKRNCLSLHRCPRTNLYSQLKHSPLALRSCISAEESLRTGKDCVVVVDWGPKESLGGWAVDLP
ncbi:hypothetical protein Syun_007541 [Stephania yunnanensis]|uniref:Uncharacterized protein n=1 Tax=Stephania yunnanensis TaxID=152371 RepID=A0AAP0PZF3_9MAGN